MQPINFELLNKEKIALALKLRYQRNITLLEILSTIDSTNSYLLARAKIGAPSGTICFAEQQTQGRGRRGRAWFSPASTNLYCSMLWRFPSSQHLSGLSIAMGVMLANMLKKYGIREGVQLKWPNDVLFAGRKLAGILLESNEPTSVVIGIGLNLYLPSDANPDWIGLCEIMGKEIGRNDLAALLMNELFDQLPMYQASGLRPFIPEWQQYDALFNQHVIVQTPEKTSSGIMRGINEQGELLLQDEQGNIHPFCYGEVSVRFR